MSNFKFRLETLLKLREGYRDERRAALAEAFHASRLLEDRMEEVANEQTSLTAQRVTISMSDQVSVDALLEIQRYEAILASEQKTLARQQKMLEVEIERRRQATADADREVRVLENLRERQRQRHDAEESIAIQKELDEFAVQRHARKDRTPCHG